VQRARRIFNLDADIRGAGRQLGVDPVIGPLARARPGLRPPGTWDPFEMGVRAIAGQQVSVAGGGTVAARIAERHGTPVPGLRPFGLTHTFPAAPALAEADLRGLGLTAAREAAVRGFARAVAAGAVRLDRSVDLDGLVGSMTAVPGIGPWTAQYLALRLGEPDAFPAGDRGLQRALGDVGATPGTAAAAAVFGARAEDWRPWRAHAATHLWLRDRPVARSGRPPHPLRAIG
jgi:AraC family transcriptional regulator of adaptative response / DNA-3-methyladenine glycosylase II